MSNRVGLIMNALHGTISDARLLGCQETEISLVCMGRDENTYLSDSCVEERQFERAGPSGIVVNFAPYSSRLRFINYFRPNINYQR